MKSGFLLTNFGLHTKKDMSQSFEKMKKGKKKKNSTGWGHGTFVLENMVPKKSQKAGKQKENEEHVAMFQ